MTENDLLDAAARQGCRVSKDQLKRWRRAGLIPRPTQAHEKGRRGSRAVYPPGALRQLLAVCKLHREVRVLDQLRFRLWWAGDYAGELAPIRNFLIERLERLFGELREHRDRYGVLEQLSQQVRHGHRRRLGARHPRCSECGEDEPAAVLGRAPHFSCYECQCRAAGKSTVEAHHFAGRANDSFTIPLAGNPHRVVSDEMYTWPERTRRNPAGSGLRAVAAALRGRLAAERQMVERIDGPLIGYLEQLDERLTELHGEHWWTSLGLDPPPLR